jgi:hypothetical protein
MSELRQLVLDIWVGICVAVFLLIAVSAIAESIKHTKRTDSDASRGRRAK